jgi:hypothetical protein
VVEPVEDGEGGTPCPLGSGRIARGVVGVSDVAERVGFVMLVTEFPADVELASLAVSKRAASMCPAMGAPNRVVKRSGQTTPRAQRRCP